MGDAFGSDTSAGRELDWKRLVDSNKSRAEAYFRTFEKNADDVADLVQATWVLAFETIVEASIAEASWPEILDCCRAVGRNRARSRRRDPISLANSGRTATNVDSVSRDVDVSEDSGDADQIDEFAWDCVLRLTQRQREVLVYRLVLGKTEAETAAILRIAIGTTKVHLHRALRSLRGFACRITGIDGK
jgi:RNA polymerase sigma-70 factor, ECF subfamily